jgi:hypothetical protein
MANNRSDLGAWRPVRPAEGADWLSPIGVPWWIAGGWAVDLFAGDQSRLHEDLDIGVLRRDVPAVRAALSSWEFFQATAGVLTRLPAGGAPPSDVHSLWCRPTGTDLWTLELMLDESEGDMWLFRRQPEVRRALSTVFRWNSEGIPYLAPEIQLLYKAQRPRERDQADFNRIACRLDDAARIWLLDALVRIHPKHEWILALGDYD